MKRLAVLTAALATLCALPAAAQTYPSMQSVLQSVFALHSFSNVAISPHGDAVAWQDEWRPGGLAHPKLQSELFIERIGSAPVRLTAGDGKTFADETQAAWSPDGKRIAFLSDAASKDQQQIFIANADGSGVKQLTHLTGYVQHMEWSPDGTSIAVLQIAHPHRKSGATQAGARQVGVIGSTIDEQQIGIVDAASGAVRDITPANAYVYEYGWSPDSKHLAYTYAYGSGDNNWWIARLATIAIDGSARRDLFKPPFQINDPQWSPDGRSIALIGGLMSDFGSVGGDVYLVDARSGKARDITPGMPLSAASLRWAGSHLLMVAHSKGAEHLYTLSTGGRVRALTSLPEAIRSWSATKNGTSVAMVRESFAQAAEVWAGAPEALHPITHANAAVPRMYGRARSLQWKDGAYNVQGWLIYPLYYDESKRYPMITIIHGGPSAESLPSYDSRNVAALASHGYFVFEPNPRGSFGQGEAFTRGNIKDFGYGDWRDDLAGVDVAVKAASIDPQRLGLFGWSYGGYMGMWAETQTRRFKAIVAGAGVVNWQSYYGQNDIDEWMIPFFGASVYQDPAVYAKSSPITFIEHSHTPVLILQGERDEEVPAPQAFEFYHAMQTLNVPSRLVVYADEGHGPRKPENQIDILNRMVQWFGVYLR
jgi:dipeptidyl aminopeptidase/acylaminoacyl peptidase